jgi:hypothetical protein
MTYTKKTRLKWATMDTSVDRKYHVLFQEKSKYFKSFLLTVCTPPVHFQFRTLGDYWLGTLRGISLESSALFFQPETIVCRWTAEEWLSSPVINAFALQTHSS